VAQRGEEVERGGPVSAIVLFGVFASLILINVPIAVALGISSLLVIWLTGISNSVLPVVFYASIAKFTLLAVPFFIMTGFIMEKAGISKRLIAFANALVGHLNGGLIIVLVITSMFFAAISGSGPATVAALGVILIPAMVNAGYNASKSAALMAMAGGIGVIIPPSITYVIYGVVASQSIGKIFIAGIVPGILVGVALMIAGLFSERRTKPSRTKRASLQELFLSFKDAFWGLLTPIIILGGIYGGIFTPTEAAAVSCVYGLMVGIFIYKEIGPKDIFETLIHSAASTAVVMLIIASASIFAWIISVEGITETISTGVLRMFSNKFMIMILINILLLIVGCFIDAVSALYIITPILLPIAIRIGIDPIHFGIIMCVNLSIGLSTPPVGVNLYVACGITNISLKQISRSLGPVLVASIIALLLITYIPGISLWLPSVFDM
jgi:C4-dicarboxylate transporter, DctM subunit